MDENVNDRGRAAATVAVLTFFAALPPIVAAATLAARGWFPAGDHAQAELRMRGFWSHPPQLGAAGRLGTLAEQGSHPGPLAWWLMYPVYFLGGSDPGSLSLAVAIAAVVWLAVAVWQSVLLGGKALALCVVISAVIFIRALGPSVFVEPWNPWFAIMPFAATVLAAATAMHRPALAIPTAVIAGSFATQAHVGFAPVVTAVILTGIVGAFVRFRDRAGRRRIIGICAVSAAGGVAAWALPIRQQIVGDPGNMSLILRTFDSESAEPMGLSGGLHVATQLFDLFGPWMRSTTSLAQPDWFDPGFIPTVVLWAGAGYLSVRLRDADSNARRALHLHLVLLVGFAATIAATSRVYGDPFTYVMLFGPTLMMLIAACSLWSYWIAYRALSSGEQEDRQATIATVAISILAAALVAVSIVQFRGVETPGEPFSKAVGSLGGELEHSLEREDDHIVRWLDPVALGANGFGLLLELERQGFDVGVDDVHRVPAQAYRVKDPSTVDTVLWVVTGDRIDEFDADPGARRVAYVDTRTDAQKEVVDATQAEIRRRLEGIAAFDLADDLGASYWTAMRDERFPQDLNDDMEVLFDLGLPTAVFSADPTWTP